MPLLRYSLSGAKKARHTQTGHNDHRIKDYKWTITSLIRTTRLSSENFEECSLGSASVFFVLICLRPECNPNRTAIYFEECFLIFLKALPSGCQIPMFFCSSVAALRTSPKVSVKGRRVSACCRHHNRRRVTHSRERPSRQLSRTVSQRTAARR